MTDTPDPLNAAIDRALAAARAATDASQEAEAALAARAEITAALTRATRRIGWFAACAAGAATLVIGGGAALWLRSSGDLRQTTELHAATAAAFVERLAEMNGALDRMDAAITRAEAANTAAEARLADLESRIDTRLQTVAQAMQGDATLVARIDTLRADLLAAVAEVDLSVNRTLAGAGPDPALQAVVKQLTDAAARLAAQPAAAPTPRTTADRKPASQPDNPRKPASRPAARPAAGAAATNPFRYP